MAGKSTYIRQVALLTLMAQIGSFVPAREATIGIADRIFARVGASDELTRGQSTFMVEMTETARILNTATPRSLVILDEIGRGTSTYDGISLAWAVVEYLHEHVGCRTLFATHYHELTDLEKSLSGVKNLNVAVREWQDEVVFLHKIVEGAADKSYGIHVARLAGVPREVIERAKEILAQLEEEHLDAEGRAKIARRPIEPKKTHLQLTLFGPAEHPLLDELRRLGPEQPHAASGVSTAPAVAGDAGQGRERRNANEQVRKLSRTSIHPDAWLLDPAITYLNHGSFGACPRVVLERQQELRLEMEREPVDVPRAAADAAAWTSRATTLAGLIGADPADLVFVQNATGGRQQRAAVARFPAGRRNPRDRPRLQRLPQRGPLRRRAERGGRGRSRRAAADRRRRSRWSTPCWSGSRPARGWPCWITSPAPRP